MDVAITGDWEGVEGGQGPASINREGDMELGHWVTGSMGRWIPGSLGRWTTSCDSVTSLS